MRCLGVSSAIVPLLSGEAGSAVMVDLLNEDGEQVVWWGTWVECAVAVSRLKREGSLDEEADEGARTVLDRLAADWAEVQPVDDMRLLASLLAKKHPLKAADALQLAAALRWCEGDTSGAGFVCLDERLRRTALDEGFDVLPESPEDGDGEL